MVHCGTLYYTLVHCGALWYTLVNYATLLLQQFKAQSSSFPVIVDFYGFPELILLVLNESRILRYICELPTYHLPKL